MIRFECHSSECDVVSPPGSISDTINQLGWNRDLCNPNASDDNCEADDESNKEKCSAVQASKFPEHRIMSSMLIVPGLTQPTRKSMKLSENGLGTVSAIETNRIMGHKKGRTDLVNMISPCSICCFTEMFTERYITGE